MYTSETRSNSLKLLKFITWMVLNSRLKGQYTRNFRCLVYCLYEISLLQHNHWYQNYSCTIILHGIKALQSSLSKPVWVNIIIERNATRTALYLKDHSCCISASLVIISNISCLELPLAMRYT